MFNARMTPCELNMRNSDFWSAQARLVDERILDPIVRNGAIGKVLFDQFAYADVQNRVGFEDALENSAKAVSDLKQQIPTDFGKQGGRPPRRDALDSHILTMLKNEPDLVVRNLRFKLKPNLLPDLIKENKDGVITFIDSDGSKKTAKISGLKDRLYRLKKNKGSQ